MTHHINHSQHQQNPNKSNNSNTAQTTTSDLRTTTFTYTPQYSDITIPTKVYCTTSHRKIADNNHEKHQPHPPKTRQTTLSTLPSDNDFMGDITRTKCQTTLRIYYANVNGINPNHNHERLNMILDNMNSIDADIIGFAEHNLDVSQMKVRYDLQSLVKRHIPSSRTIAATSPMQFPTTFKPGGCMNIVARSLHSRITEQGQDSLG